MEEKTYKARVEVGFVVELNVNAVHEDEASAVAEEIIWNNSYGLIKTLIRHYRIPNVGVRCIEVEEA